MINLKVDDAVDDAVAGNDSVGYAADNDGDVVQVLLIMIDIYMHCVGWRILTTAQRARCSISAACSRHTPHT